MKKLLQRLRPPLVLLIISFFAGCATEETISVNPSGKDNELKSRFISLDELEKMPGVMDKLNSFTKRGSNKKLVSCGKYKFSVDTEKVLLLEKGNYKSLTFSTLRDGPSNKFENLFLHPHKGGYLAFLMEADFDDFDRRNLDVGDPIAGLLYKLQFTPLNDFDMPGLDVEYTTTDNWTGNTYNYPGRYWKENGKCWTWHNYAAAGEEVDFRPIECPGCCPEDTGGGAPVNTSGPRLVWQQYLAIVDMIGSQGGSGSSGPGSGGSGSGGLFIPGDGFYTPFNPVKPEQVDPLDPQNEDLYHPNPIIGVVSPNLSLDDQLTCNELKTKSENATFQAKMAELKSKAATQDFESAYTLYQNASNGLVFSPEATGSSSAPEVSLNLNQSSTQTPTNAIGFMHCHLDNGTTFKVFSFSDIMALAQVADSSTRFTHELAVYVTTASGTFALKVNSKIKLKDNLMRMQLAQNRYEQDFKEYVNLGQTIDEQIMGLLKFMKKEFSDTTLGIDLYQQSTNGTWEKLELSNNGKQVKRKPC